MFDVTAELDSVVSFPLWNFLKIEYLDKIKTELENILPDYQGPRWVQIMKKNRGIKSRDTLPLSCNFLFVSGTYGIKESCLEI